MSNLEKLISSLDAALPANTSTRGADPDSSSEGLMYEIRMAILSCPLVLDYMSYLVYKESLVELSSLKIKCMEFCRLFVGYKRGEEEPSEQLSEVLNSLNEYFSRVTEFYSLQETKHSWINSVKSDLLDETNSAADSEENLARKLVSETIPKTLTGGYLVLPENIDLVFDSVVKLAYKGEPFSPDNYICSGCKTRFGVVTSIDGLNISTSSEETGSSKTIRFPFFSSTVSTFKMTYEEDYDSLLKNMYTSGILDEEDYYVKVATRGLRLSRYDVSPMPSEINIEYPFYVKQQFSYIKRLFSRHSSPLDLFTFLSKGANLSTSQGISTQQNLNDSIAAISEFADIRSSI